MEKQCRDRKRKEKEKREKVNRERVVDGLSPLAMPETTPEQDLLPSTSGDVDYSTLETPNTEATGGQSSGQRRAGTEPPALAVDESMHVRTTDERTPARPGVEALERVLPPRHQVGPGTAPVGHSTGVGGPVRAPRSSSRKCKLDATSR